jgi:hypothetical protein
MKEDEMGGACRARGAMRNAYKFFVRKPEGKRPLSKPERDGRIILKWVLRNSVGECGLDSSRSW